MTRPHLPTSCLTETSNCQNPTVSGTKMMAWTAAGAKMLCLRDSANVHRHLTAELALPREAGRYRRSRKLQA